jgi:septal ring factor EnvC (AmiA/AmiB activator)
VSTARCNIIRAQPQPSAVQINRKRQKLEDKVAKANATIERWWKRLSRAAIVIRKHQKQVARAQKQLQQLQS